MQIQTEKNFIDRKDFRVRKDGQIYCPHISPKDNSGTSNLFMENTGKGLDELLRVQYELLLLNNGEKGFYPCKCTSKINELSNSGMSDEEIFENVCQPCSHYNLSKKRVEKSVLVI
jgi:hypothetical protein